MKHVTNSSLEIVSLDKEVSQKLPSKAKSEHVFLIEDVPTPLVVQKCIVEILL